MLQRSGLRKTQANASPHHDLAPIQTVAMILDRNHDLFDTKYQGWIYSSAAMARAGLLLDGLVSKVDGGKRTVDAQSAVSNNLLDDALLLKVGQTSAGNGSVDLHSVDEDRDGDQAVGLDILVKLVGGGLVEEDGVLSLVLNWWIVRSVLRRSRCSLPHTLSLGPLLLSLLWSGVCWSLATELVSEVCAVQRSHGGRACVV